MNSEEFDVSKMLDSNMVLRYEAEAATTEYSEDDIKVFCKNYFTNKETNNENGKNTVQNVDSQTQNGTQSQNPINLNNGLQVVPENIKNLSIHFKK